MTLCNIRKLAVGIVMAMVMSFALVSEAKALSYIPPTKGKSNCQSQGQGQCQSQSQTQGSSQGQYGGSSTQGQSGQQGYGKGKSNFKPVGGNLFQ
jgi:hypothetical protein